MELNICHLYPEVLNLYGDRGNIRCLSRRLSWRGIDCHVDELKIGEKKDLTAYDLFSSEADRTSSRRSFLEI